MLGHKTLKVRELMLDRRKLDDLKFRMRYWSFWDKMLYVLFGIDDVFYPVYHRRGGFGDVAEFLRVMWVSLLLFAWLEGCLLLFGVLYADDVFFMVMYVGAYLWYLTFGRMILENEPYKRTVVMIAVGLFLLEFFLVR